MPFEPFEAAWQRWDRARAHLGEAVDVWNGFIADQDAFDFVLDGDGSGTFILRVLQGRRSLTRFPGQFRCGDHAAVTAVV